MYYFDNYLNYHSNSTSLHFRFKNNEEEQVKEWEQWAESNGIKVVKGTIYSWI